MIYETHVDSSEDDSYLTYPDSDDMPMAETTRHYDVLTTTKGNLDVLYEVQQAGEVFVASPNYAWGAFAYDRYLPYFTADATVEQAKLR